MHVAVFTKRTIGHESFKSNFSPKLRLISPKKKKKRKKSQLYNHEIPNSRNDRQHCSIQIPKRGGASHIWDPPRQNATNSPELRLISPSLPRKDKPGSPHVSQEDRISIGFRIDARMVAGQRW